MAMSSIGYARAQESPQFIPDAYNPGLPYLPMPDMGGTLPRSRTPGGRAHKRWKARRASGMA